MPPDSPNPSPRKAYYVETISRTVTTLLVYADNAKEAKRRARFGGEAVDAQHNNRGVGKARRAPEQDRDA